MKKFAIIGNPVAHSKSPQLHNYIFRRLGVSAEYQREKVEKNQAGEFVKRLRGGEFHGINVTLPLKEEMAGVVDTLSDGAARLGAVNCILLQEGTLKGYNTDVIGFKNSLRMNNINLAGRTCVLLGAGGAARSILAAAADENPARVIIVNRTLERALKLGEWITELVSGIPAEAFTPESVNQEVFEKAVIINSTPVGMYPKVEASPLPLSLIGGGQDLIDAIYTPPETLFLRSGREKGVNTVSGVDMFVSQALASQDIWLGKDISSKLSTGELKQFLKETD